MSTIAVDNVRPSLGGTSTDLMEGLSKAWGNTVGTGTPAANDSYNLASITDVGAGDQDMNFTNVFASANHAPSATTFMNGTTPRIWIESLAAGLFSFRTQNTAGTPTDADIQSWKVAGDLA